MKRLLPISLLLAALCISTAAFAQKDKVVEASSKRKPAWIGSSDRSHFAVTEVGETLAAASGKCMASIRQYIVNAVAVNVSSAEKMATRQITRDQLVTAMSDYSSALMTEAGQLPYLNDITLSTPRRSTGSGYTARRPRPTAMNIRCCTPFRSRRGGS